MEGRHDSAPPAATAALAIGDNIKEMAEKHFGLK
jgi:hypothetical protein